MVAEMNIFDAWTIAGVVVGLVLAIYSNLTVEEQIEYLLRWDTRKGTFFRWQYGSEDMYRFMVRCQWFLLPFFGGMFGYMIGMKGNHQ
jgi:hypothetical protein